LGAGDLRRVRAEAVDLFSCGGGSFRAEDFVVADLDDDTCLPEDTERFDMAAELEGVECVAGLLLV
jgi:hypothetical protein